MIAWTHVCVPTIGVLSKHFATELDAIECASSMVYRFGESENYGERAVLMYDGIHYDILAEEKGDEVRVGLLSLNFFCLLPA